MCFRLEDWVVGGFRKGFKEVVVGLVFKEGFVDLVVVGRREYFRICISKEVKT